MKKFIAILLCLVTLISAAACSSGSVGNTGTQNSNTVGGETGTGSKESEDPQYQHDLPEDLKYDGTSVRIFTHTGYKCNIFADETDDLTDSITEAVYYRVLNVESALGVEIEVVGDANWDNSNNLLHESLLANSDDYDLIVGYGVVNISLAAESLMVDLNNVENINLKKSYWDQNFIDNLSYQDKTFWATGDILYNYLGNTYVTFASTQIWEDKVSQTENRSIYDIVKANEWTYDAMCKYIAVANDDLNADGVFDEEDIAGLVGSYGHMADAYLYGFGGSYGRKTDNGEINIVLDEVHILNIYSKLYELFCENVAFTNADDGTSVEVFTENRALFYTMMLGIAFNQKFRDMTPDDAYTIIPLPLYDESQTEYASIAFNGLPIIGVPVTVPEDRLPALGATLELLAYEGYQSVYPAYYEVALKAKLSRNDESAEMMDLIRQNIKTDFVYMWSQKFGNPQISELFKIGIAGERSDLSALLAAQLGSYRTEFARLLENYASVES